MKKWLLTNRLLFFWLLAFCSQGSLLLYSDLGFSQGSIEDGRIKAAVCVACHGIDGNSINPEWPSLAGQHAQYIEKQLQSFQNGQRDNILMNPFVMPLTAQGWDSFGKTNTEN